MKIEAEDVDVYYCDICKRFKYTKVCGHNVTEMTVLQALNMLLAATKDDVPWIPPNIIIEKVLYKIVNHIDDTEGLDGWVEQYLPSVSDAELKLVYTWLVNLAKRFEKGDKK